MNRITLIIFAFLLLCCILLFCQWQCAERKITKCEEQFTALADSINSAKPRIDTTWQIRTLKDTITVYQRTSRILVDTVYCAPRTYTGTYNSDMLAVRWKAQVFGQLDKIEILPSSSYKFPEITIQKTVILPGRKGVEVNNREKSHLYMDAGVVGFSKISGVDIGFTYIYRSRFGVRIGVLYNDDQLYWKGGFNLKLK